MTTVYRTPTYEDCELLAAEMRPADRRECEAVTGTAKLAPDLWRCTQNCFECQSMFVDGKLVAIFGVGFYPGDDTVGIPWLLGTRELDRFMFSLCRDSKATVARWHERFAVLTNCTDKRNRRILMWLRWLGFQILPTEIPTGMQQLPFLQFISTRGT
jgi:hypothetical protein